MLLKIFGVFSVIALLPIIATSLAIGFVNFDYGMLSPQMWSKAARGFSIAWVIFIYGSYFVLWARFQIEDL